MRCVAADGALLASGSSDHAIRVWRASSGSGGNPSDGRGGGSGGTISAPAGMPFDLAGDRAVLEGHAGPVSCLQLTPSLLASGSWDCSVRLWDRGSLECLAMVHTGEGECKEALRWALGLLFSVALGPAEPGGRGHGACR